jgi:LysR family transcriptional regulator, glycine cleavage system transcriptional activator
MPAHLPSLNALRAFEAAGRHLSFSKAAEELHVTPAAVGHQVKALEHELGSVLFNRLNRALQLTPAGQALLPGLSEVFYRVTEVVETFRRRDASRPLTVSMPPSFGATWLMPRLERFRARYPGIDVRLDVDNRLVDLIQDDVDVGLRYGLGDYPGMRVDCLLSEEVFPVCSPRLLHGAHPLRELDDLRWHTLLHVDGYVQDDYWPDWSMWLHSAGMSDMAVRRELQFSQTSLALQAAARGHGVALGSRVLAGNDLEEGRLVRPFAHGSRMSFAYYMVCPEALAEEPRIAAFREWIIEEAAAAEGG